MKDFKEKKVDKQLTSLLEEKSGGLKQLVGSEKLVVTDKNLSQKIQTIFKFCFIQGLQ